jgi:outer membrane protein insertion porin family
MAFQRTFLALSLWATASATVIAEPFVVKSIDVQGLQRVGLGAVLTYLPVRVGDKLSPERTPQLIRALYASGSFDDVRIVQNEAGVLQVVVRERPTISSLSFSGNKDIKTEELQKALKGIGLNQGEVLNRSVLAKVEQELEQQYFSRGKYSVGIKTLVTPLPRNRVDIKFVVNEGSEATIAAINLIGTHTFSNEELTQKFELLSDKAWWKFWQGDPQYSKEKLGGDLETLRSYYMDRGYLKFQIVSTQVSLSPDRQHVYITVNVDEGAEYKIASIKLVGQRVVPEADLQAAIPFAAGDTFSQAQITAAEQQLKARLAKDGYSFARVRTIPEEDAAKKEVGLVFYMDPGKRAYVRRINFQGNTKTADEVLRREMRQMEGAWYSSTLLDNSKLRLERLGYFESVEAETLPVAGSDDQLDINVKVKEGQFGQFMAGIGYGQGSGLSFNTSVSQDNFLGSGKKVSVSLNKSTVVKSIDFGYTNPYYTDDGVSRGFHLFYQVTDYSRYSDVSSSQDSWGGSVNYGIPLTDFSRLNLGATYSSNTLNIFSDVVSVQVRDFFEHNQKDLAADKELGFDQFSLSASWAYNDLNRAIFPTKGLSSSLWSEVATPLGDLTYYKLGLDARNYWSLTKNDLWSVMLAGGIAYGDGYGSMPDGSDANLPYFENLSFGGDKGLRGFKYSRVGPRELYRNPRRSVSMPSTDGAYVAGDALDPLYDQVSLGRAIGGNFRLTSTLELVVPTPFIENQRSMRTSFFVEAGSVWDTNYNAQAFSDLLATERDNIPDFQDYSAIRASTGMTMQWLSPLGPISFTLAKALKKESYDETDVFQFNIGRTY